MPILGKEIPADYRILVSRSNTRPKAELYPFNLQEPIPSFPLPLRHGDREPLLDLQVLINEVYQRAGLDLAIDYSTGLPAVSENDRAWINQVLQQQGLTEEGN